MYLAGIDYDRFGSLTLKEMQIIAKAYSEKVQADFELRDTMAYVQGRYVVEALLCTVGNMFSKGKPMKYPDKPYSQNKEVPLTEEEIQRQRELFVANLKAMETNFNLEKEKKKKKQGVSK